MRERERERPYNSGRERDAVRKSKNERQGPSDSEREQDGRVMARDSDKERRGALISDIKR